MAKHPARLEQPPVTFATQALGFVRQTPVVPFFGPTTVRHQLHARPGGAFRP